MAVARLKLAALFVACRPCPARMNRAGAPWPTPSHPSRVFPFLCRSTALVSDIIAPLHFANDPMQQAGRGTTREQPWLRARQGARGGCFSSNEKR